jgi:hypothetical protein
MNDLNMGTITPSKVDKAFRYKRHAPGKGELPSRHRGYSATDVIRKRKRHNHDKDVSCVRQHQLVGWQGSGDESDYSVDGEAEKRGKGGKRQTEQQGKPGWMRSVFTFMSDFPTSPHLIFQWVQLGVNILLTSAFVYFAWSIFDTVRSDIRNANDAARAEILSRILSCQNQYTSNQCANNDRPALKAACEEWYECMSQDPDAVYKIKATVKQVAEIINEFSGAMHLRAWVCCSLSTKSYISNFN